MWNDPLVYLPIEKWTDVQAVFKKDWPRGTSAYWGLETQREWIIKGIQHDFKVYCPFGDVKNGMVAVNLKNTLYEIIIQCPRDDTSQLQLALSTTRLIDWSKPILVPYPPPHIVECIENVSNNVNVNIKKDDHANELMLLSKDRPLFSDVSTPKDITFELVSEEHIPLIDSSWINRYSSSPWYFQLLIRAKSGFGIFKNKKLACWVFISEVGALTHLFTLKEFRKQGYAEILLKLVCNDRLKEKKDCFAYCRKGNVNAFNLYTKLGFEKFHPVFWSRMTPKT